MASPPLIQLPNPPPSLPQPPSSSSHHPITPPSTPPFPSLSSPDRHHPTSDAVVSWTSSIARLARRGRLSSAAAAFSQMLSSPSSPPPNHITLLTLLSSCADFPSSPSSFPLGLSLHSLLLKLFPPSLPLDTALLDFYAKCDRPDSARQIFDRMPSRNSITFNTMIAGHIRNGEIALAVSLFDEMKLHVRRDRVSWTVLIDGFVKNGLLDDALEYFRAMLQDGVEPDYVTAIAVAAACAGLGALGQGMWVHRLAMGRDFYGNVRLGNSLIDMYSRCGRIDFAHQVFSGMPVRTLVTWNSMIVGFAANGCSQEALDHFGMMRRGGFEPDGVSFTGALTACSHAGLVEEGLQYYREMKKNNVTMRVEHYGCVVDLLGRAGRLEEAMRVVESMGPATRPNEVVLGSLLAACRVHGDAGLAERLMSYLLELEPETDSNYVLLSNIYAAAGRWDGVARVRNMMKSLGIKKRPGFSAVEIDGDVHEFVAGDRTHRQSDDIYELLSLLRVDMELHGYHSGGKDNIASQHEIVCELERW